MSNNSNYFKEQFLDFIEEEKNFFTHYKNKFIINFLKIIKTKYPNIKLNKDIKINLDKFYISLFLNPAIKTNNYKDIIIITDLLNSYNIQKDIINKSFLLMINQYTKHIFSSANLEKLKKLINLLDFYINFLNCHFKENEIKKVFPEKIYDFYENKQKLYLFGIYKGVPISHNTRIYSINEKDKTLTIYANHYQLVAAKFQKDIYLLEPKSNTTLKAYIKKINPTEQTLIISDIQQIDRSITKRNYIRVQPKNEIKALIQWNENEYEGIIYDLSIKGISIISKKFPIDLNDKTTISFTLPIENNKTFSFHLFCDLRSISSYSDNLLRYHFYFEPTPLEENELEKYIKNREKEIVKELLIHLKKEFIELS